MEAQSMQKKIAPLFLGGTFPFFVFQAPFSSASPLNIFV